jgi:hypothetical protein
MVYSACAVTARCDISVMSLQWKERDRRKTTSASKWSVLRYWLISTKLALFVGHARQELGMVFQLHHCNGRWDTTKNYFGLQVKCPSLLTGLNQLALFVGHVRWVVGVMFQLRHCNGRRNTEEKLLRPPNEVPFIINRVQPNLYSL